MPGPLCRRQTPPKRGKRKLPLPNLDAIEDVDERRRQRRLIKNRNTAAASRCALLFQSSQPMFFCLHPTETDLQLLL